MNLICFIADVLINAPLGVGYFDNRHPAGVFSNPAPPTHFSELPNSFC